MANKAVSIGKLSTYSGSFGIPEGDYTLSFEFKLYKPEKSQYDSTLGCLVTFEKDGSDPREHFYSFGRNAKEYFTVDPKSKGKRIIAVAGKEGGSLNDNTSHAVLLKSMYNSGLPDDVYDDDVSVLDGVVVHIQSEDEPDSWKGLKAQSTGDEEAKPRTPKKIPVVTEFISAPWIEEVKGKKADPKPAGKPAAKGKPEPEPEEEESGDEAEVAELAMNLVADVLGENPDGMAKLKMRVALLPKAKKQHGDEKAQEIVAFLFSDEDNLTAALDQLGYKLKAGNIVAK